MGRGWCRFGMASSSRTSRWFGDKPMPKAACPACNSAVKYPRDAEAGTEVTCADCDEVFVPPELKVKGTSKKKYSVDDEETYDAERPIADADKARKRKRVAAAVHHAREQAREEAKWHKTSGPEVFLL